MAKNDKFNYRHEKVIQALIETNSLRDAASAVGISESTIHRYLNNPDFQKRYKDTRNQILTSLIGKLQQAAHDSLACLVKIINDPKSREHNKVMASKTVLELAFKGAELSKLQDIEDRLEQVERGPRAV